MANVNSGLIKRFENGAIVLVGADTLLNIVPGSVVIRHRQRERVPNRDRGVLTDITVGDQRPQEIEFQLWVTPDTDTLMATMNPAATAGAETFFQLTISEPSYLGAATGDRWVFNRCYMPDGFDKQAGGEGQDKDRVTVRLVHYGDIITPTTY